MSGHVMVVQITSGLEVVDGVFVGPLTLHFTVWLFIQASIETHFYRCYGHCIRRDGTSKRLNYIFRSSFKILFSRMVYYFCSELVLKH